MAICVAVIDKDNAPLFIKCSEKTADNAVQNELKLHYTVHSSLDIIEEKLNQPTSSTAGRSSDLRELYLGLLLSTEEYKVYGYATNTKVKFVIVTDLGNTGLKDQEIRSMFKRLHNVYCNVVSNPFYIPCSTIESQ